MHLDPIVAELGHKPSQRELIASGRADLVGAIQKLGGYRKVAAALGYRDDPTKGHPVRWRSIEDLRPHLDPMVSELGRRPTKKEVAARARAPNLTRA